MISITLKQTETISEKIKNTLINEYQTHFDKKDNYEFSTIIDINGHKRVLIF